MLANRLVNARRTVFLETPASWRVRDTDSTMITPAALLTDCFSADELYTESKRIKKPKFTRDCLLLRARMLRLPAH
jgi:hypothetical protein